MSISSSTTASPSRTEQFVDFFWTHGKKLTAGLFWLALLGGYFWTVRRTGASVQDVAVAVRSFLASSAWGPLVYILLYTVRPLIFFPATAATGVGGYLYGPGFGLLYTTVGANLSATLAYLVGRLFGGDLFDGEDAEADTFLTRYATALRHNGFEAVLVMRLTYLPYDLVNYLSGFLRVPWLQYAVATVIGILPGSLTFVLLGSVLQSGGTGQRIALLGFSVATLLIGLILARVLRRRRLPG